MVKGQDRLLLLFQVSAESLNMPAMNSYVRSIEVFLEKIYSTWQNSCVVWTWDT